MAELRCPKCKGPLDVRGPATWLSVRLPATLGTVRLDDGFGRDRYVVEAGDHVARTRPRIVGLVGRLDSARLLARSAVEAGEGTFCRIAEHIHGGWYRYSWIYDEDGWRSLGTSHAFVVVDRDGEPAP